MAKAKSKQYYISNAEFLEEMKKYNETGIVSNRLAEIVILLCDRIGTHRWFCGYTYLDEMKAEARVKVMEKLPNFDVNIGQNPYAYYTSIIFNAFRAYLKAEKRQADIKDELKMEYGLDPSYNYEDRHDNSFYTSDSE